MNQATPITVALLTEMGFKEETLKNKVVSSFLFGTKKICCYRSLVEMTEEFNKLPNPLATLCSDIAIQSYNEGEYSLRDVLEETLAVASKEVETDKEILSRIKVTKTITSCNGTSDVDVLVQLIPRT